MTDSEKSGEQEKSGERIAKLLARAGVASRREVERMIAEGRVRIGETLVETPATILPDLAGVTVDGKPVARPAAARLFRFHKPAGLITAERDPAGRPTIYNALRNALPPGTPRMMPVGRLDFNTEGLLLLTNDGELKRALELPSSGIPRTYRARAFGEVTQAQLEELIEGIEIEGVRYGPIDANMERGRGHNKWIEMTLTEGKNREVRRVLEHLGLEVSRLIRIGYGPFPLGELMRGAVDEVRPQDVERFRKALGLAPEKFPDAPPPPSSARAPAAQATRPGLPPRPVRATPRKPETMPATPPVKAPGKADTKPGASRKLAENSKRRPPRRDDERDSRLVDRPQGRPANSGAPRGGAPRGGAPRTAGSSVETASPAAAPTPKRSTKGWAKPKPKPRRPGSKPGPRK